MDEPYLLTGEKVLSWSKEAVEALSTKTGDNYDKYIIFKKLYQTLTEAKNKINAVQEKWNEHRNFNENVQDQSFELVVAKNSVKKYQGMEDWGDWNTAKKITNPHELIHIPSKNLNNSIAYYIPVSRSYFKMVEMIHEFKLFENWKDKNMVIACLAEGPGGFIEAIVKNRMNNYDKIYGITLRGNNKSVPNWRRMQYALGKLNKDDELKPNVDLTHGDLYQDEDIRRFINRVKTSSALITADGGFDYTTSFNYQEQVSYRLIFSEILTAFHLQAQGGTFICKIFDIFSVLSMKMIYLVYCFYDKVYFYKPKTSRPANSEKYLVAIGFKGVQPIWLGKLRDIQNKWIKNDSSTIDIEELKLPNDFITSIYKFNDKFIKFQIDNIEQTLSLIDNPPTKNMYQKMLLQQVNNALEWCEKYDESINYKSKYRTSY